MIGRDGGRSRDPLVRAGRFVLGTLVMTPGAEASIPASEMLRTLRRHASGDWGDLDPCDKAANDVACEHGGRLLSCYHSSAGTKFWIITEADRSCTTVLLPEEY